MRDYLLDIVQHTYGLGVIDMIKITGTTEGTAINAFDQATKTVILDAEFKAPIAEFVGIFGMPNLDRLNTILNLPVYRENAKISVSTQQDPDGNTVPSGLNFENDTGDFKNNYRFMSTAVINDQLKNIKMRPVKWGVELVPTVASIQKLSFQHQAHSDATAFSTKLENGNLNFYFGDHSSHAGHFTFASGLTGTLTKQLNWPIGVFKSIFNLPGDKTFRVSDDGVAEVTVDSGLAVYTYKIPALTK